MANATTIKASFEMMKMDIAFNFAIDVEESDSLESVKEKVFDKFWEIASQQFSIPKHGKSSSVQLKDKDVEIDTDNDLRARLCTSTCFQVRFQVHGHS